MRNGQETSPAIKFIQIRVTLLTLKFPNSQNDDWQNLFLWTYHQNLLSLFKKFRVKRSKK